MKLSLLLLGAAASAVTAFTAVVPKARSLRVSSSASALAMAGDGGAFDFDVAIIGCGVGGHGAALHARAQGLKTAVFAGSDVGG